MSFALAYRSFVTSTSKFRDIDVAVWLSEPIDRFADVALADRLSRASGFPVDVRLASSAPVAVLFHMLRGRLLGARDEILLANLMERTGRQYHDQAPLVRRAVRDAFAG